MEEIVLTNKMQGFIAGFTVGLIVGVAFGVYIGYHYRNKEKPVVFSKFAGGSFAILWAFLHSYAIFSGEITVPFVFDVVGGIAMGQALGIDLVSSIVKIKGGK